MRKIAFFYRDYESLEAFGRLLPDLFKTNFFKLSRPQILVSNIFAGSDIKAGEFALSNFRESDSDILIIEDSGITLPENIPHITVGTNITCDTLMIKLFEFDEITGYGK